MTLYKRTEDPDDAFHAYMEEKKRKRQSTTAQKKAKRSRTR